MTNARVWAVSVCVALCCSLSGCSAKTLRLAVIPGSSEPPQQDGVHDLVAYAQGLAKVGHKVTIVNTQLDDSAAADLLTTNNSTMPADALFDAILSQGTCLHDPSHSGSS